MCWSATRSGSRATRMARAKKHWVQAMLGEDTYSPFPYFYDTTAWSGPRLFNVRGGRSGAILRPESKVAPPVRAPRALPVRLGALRMSARGSSAARPPPPRCGQDRVDVLRVRPGDAAARPVRRRGALPAPWQRRVLRLWFRPRRGGAARYGCRLRRAIRRRAGGAVHRRARTSADSPMGRSGCSGTRCTGQTANAWLRGRLAGSAQRPPTTPPQPPQLAASSCSTAG